MTRARRHQRALRCAGGLALLLSFGVPGVSPAAAEVLRYALLIGANEGHTHETPLRYAESDVDQVATTLETLGGFASERVVRIKNGDAERVRAALVDLNLAIQRDVRTGAEAVLIVYYSGHGSAGRLHLHGTTLKTDEFSKLVRLSPARLKLLVLDACRAGSLTRVKGGRQVSPFQIGLSEELRHEGYAIVTSSAAGEDAQESDALRSSIFTHHFLSALRGLGDANRDQQVTLGEAYAYAYTQALKTSMGTVAGSQHATFEYDLRGRADPVLTDLRRQHEQAQLILHEPGEYLVMPDEGPGALIEAHVKEAGGTALALPAARYRVRLRTPDSVRELRLALARGDRRHVHAETMEPLPLAQVVRKGEVEAQLATGPTIAATMHGPIGTGFTATTGLQIGWAFDLPAFSLMPRLTLGRSEPAQQKPGVRDHDLTELTAELTGLYVFDIAGISLAPMVSIGAASFRQDIALDPAAGCGADCKVSRRPFGLLTSVGGWLGWPLGRGLLLELTGELASFYLGRQPAPSQLGAVTDARMRSGTLTYRAAVGLGYRY